VSGPAYAYEFVSDGQRIGELWWDQDGACRETAGWYLRDFRQRWRALRLDVGLALTALASASEACEISWLEEAETVADETADLALRYAEALLESANGATPSRERFDIRVSGLSVLDAALSFPALATHEIPGGILLSGNLGEATLLLTLKRVRALGGRVDSVWNLTGGRPGVDAWLD
jgi:hypothetical protein